MASPSHGTQEPLSTMLYSPPQLDQTASFFQPSQTGATEKQKTMRSLRFAHSLMALRVSLKLSMLGTRWRISSVTLQPTQF